MTTQGLLEKWDAGEPVVTVEMGGLGEGYEMAIQTLAFELIRDAEPIPESGVIDNWGDQTVARLNGYGFSGAQVGAAKNLAANFLKFGYEESMATVPEDRKITITRR